MTILTSENFDREVLNSDKPVVVDFWATWCGPCMMLSPIMEELDGEMPDVKFCKLNVDDERDLAIEYGVQSIPMLLFVKNGEIAGTSIGYADKGKHPRAHRGGAMKVRLNEEQGRRREDPRAVKAHGSAIARAGLPGRKRLNVCARNSGARSPIPTSRAIAIVCSIIRRSKAARIPPQRLVGADDSVRPSPPQRSKPPLCKGRWHGEAVTEGLSTIDGLNPLRRCAPNACGHSGARL